MAPMRDPFPGIRRLRFDGGAEGDMRLIEVRNRAGLSVELLPDRCLDVGLVRLAGVPFGWIGPNGLQAGRGPGGEFDQALGGLLATCGFDHVRAAITEGGRHFPQHGTMALRPAVVEEAGPGEDGSGEAAFRVRARVTHGTLEGERYTLHRDITIPLDAPRLVLRDTVVVRGAGRPTPVMALYHVNLSRPQVGEDLRCTVDGRDRADIASMGDETRIEPAPSRPYEISMGSSLGTLAPGLRLRVDGGGLPFLQLHRRTAPGVELLCIEPVTHDRAPREALVGEADTLSGERRVSFALTFDFSI